MNLWHTRRVNEYTAQSLFSSWRGSYAYSLVIALLAPLFKKNCIIFYLQFFLFRFRRASAHLARQATAAMGELSDLEGKLAVAQKHLKDAAAQLLDTKRQAEV